MKQSREPFIEKQLLTRLLRDDSNILLVADRLKEKHFSEKSYGLIYGALIELTNTGKPVDMIHIKKEIKEDIDILQLLDVSHDEPLENIGSVDKMADTLIELWQIREAGKVAFEMVNQDSPVQYGIEALTRIQEETEIEKSETIKEILPRALELLEKRVAAYENNEVMPDVIRTGDLDIDKSGIFRKKEFIILAARPGMGKSTFAREKALQMARNGACVKYYTLEMSKEEITFLLISTEAEVNSEKIRSGNISDNEYKKIISATTVIMNLDIEIEMIKELPQLLIDMRKWRARKGFKKDAAIFVDYLQQVPNEKKNRTREQEVSQISRALMEMSKTIDVCMVGVAQLSRAVEVRGGDKRPINSDLRDSGSIEQDANVILFLYSPAYYGFETDEEGEPAKWTDHYGHEIGRKLEVIISKNRNGRCYTIWKQFQLHIGKTLSWNSPILKNHSENIIQIPNGNGNSDIPF